MKSTYGKIMYEKHLVGKKATEPLAKYSCEIIGLETNKVFPPKLG